LLKALDAIPIYYGAFELLSFLLNAYHINLDVFGD